MQSNLENPPVPRTFRVIRASAMGMCFGVRDAIALAHGTATALTILGDLVHNETVLADLRGRGIRVENRLDEIATPSVMITAHGAAEKTVQAVRERGLHVLEATCPLVRHAHNAVQNLVRQNFHPVIIGQRDHVEVRGLTGDLDEFDIILTDEDAGQLRERPRFGVAAQTTQPIERVRHLVALLRRQFPQSELRFVDTVCQPTKQRQTAAIELAQQADVVIVVGGAQSNNTRELAATCRRFCPRVHQVQDATEVQSNWFHDATVVGLTAGTSTPDHVIDGIEQRLRALAREISACQ
jgi:4-hydroxy-3-methylbut-2-enyl diphosphate reductase